MPAFLIGAGLVDASPEGRYVPVGSQAPGRAAVDQPSATPQAVSPASDRRARDTAELRSTTPPSPAPAGRPAGLRIQIVAPDHPLTADDLVHFQVRWWDEDGRYAGLSENWGDGTAASSVQLVRCDGTAGSHDGELSTAHRFPVGRYRVRLTVTTADCDGRTETQAGEVPIEIRSPGDGEHSERPPAPSPSQDGSDPPSAPVEPGPTTVSPSPGPTTTPSVPALPLPSGESLGNP